MNDNQEVVNKIIELIEDAYNPREARKIINEQFPDYNHSEKLRTLITDVLRHFDKKKRDALKKTQYFKYFLIGEDKISAL